jgi:sulfate permease, SulP family
MTNNNGASTFFPPFAWARNCDQNTVTRDFLAALIVVVMLVPQALGYALVAGMPPHIGLYVSILPPLLYCLFGTSMFLSVGVCAIIAILTKSGASLVGIAGSPEHVAAGAVIALMSGGMLIAMGLLRLGFIANFLSHTVISGFVTGSVLTIAATQVKHLLGVEAHGDTLYDIGRSIMPHLDEIKKPTVIFALGSFAAFLAVRRYMRPFLRWMGFPADRAAIYAGLGPFLVVSGAIFISWSLQSDGGFLREWLHLDKLGIKVVGSIPSGLPSISVPSFDLHVPPHKAAEIPTEAALWQALVAHSALMAIIIFVESVSIGQAFAVRRRQTIMPNQEMLALGVSNLASAFSGAYPVAGSFSRSAVNYNAGAQTPLAGILAAVGIALVAAFLTKPLYYLPFATLAALITIAALTLVDYRILGKAWNYSKRDFAAVVVTFTMTVVYGVEKGLITGLVLSIILHIYHTSRPHFAVVGLMPGTHHFRSAARHRTVTSDRVISLRVDESLYFANAKYLEEVVYGLLLDYPKAKHIILQCPAVNHIDMSALESLEAINNRLKDAGVKLHFSEIKAPIMDRLKKSDFLEHLSGDVYVSNYQAIHELAPEMIREANVRVARGDWEAAGKVHSHHQDAAEEETEKSGVLPKPA